MRLTLFRRDLENRARIEIVDEGAGACTRLPKNFRIVRLDLFLLVGVDRSIAQRRAVIRGALKNRQMADFLRDLRDELHAGGAGADDADAFAREVRLLTRPPGGMKRLALEAIDACEIGDIMRRQDADRRDEKFSARASAVAEPHFPLIRGLIEARRFDARVELDVAAQVELIGDVVEIALGLRLSGEMFLPVPLLQEFLGERIAIAVAFGIEARAGIAIPVPGASHAAAFLIHAHLQPELAQTVELIQTGHARADDDRVELRYGLFGFRHSFSSGRKIDSFLVIVTQAQRCGRISTVARHALLMESPPRPNDPDAVHSPWFSGVEILRLRASRSPQNDKGAALRLRQDDTRRDAQDST
jgi:hypothetical protein